MMLQTGTIKVRSILEPIAVKANSVACRALMNYLHQLLGDRSTVSMVQVENKAGLLGGP